MAGRIGRWGAVLGLGALWWWGVLRLALAPGRWKGRSSAGGWGLSLLPVHCVPKAEVVRADAGARAAGGVGYGVQGRVGSASRGLRGEARALVEGAGDGCGALGGAWCLGLGAGGGWAERGRVQRGDAGRMCRGWRRGGAAGVAGGGVEVLLGATKASLRRRSAQDLPRRERRGVGGQVQHGVGDVLGFADPAEWRQPGHDRFRACLGVPVTVGHRRTCPAGRDRVDTDAVRADLGRPGSSSAARRPPSTRRSRAGRGRRCRWRRTPS